MRRLLLAIAAGATLLGGCQVLQPVKADIPVAQELPAPAREAQRVLNEAGLALSAMTDDIASKVSRGVITSAQATQKIATVKRHRDDVVQWQRDLDKAVVAMNLGDMRKVENQAKALELLLETLEKEIAALERKGG